VFATLRFSDDRLDPDSISAILGIRSTKSWRKGECYFAGQRAGWLVGRTGTWFLATDDLVPGLDLDPHIEFLIGLMSQDLRGKVGAVARGDAARWSQSGCLMLLAWRGWGATARRVGCNDS
jgi:Domain of unknown function (DUF4279)